jgi:hypothetical protein
VGPYGESSAVVVCQPQAPPADLPPEEAILFDQIGERLPLPAIKPTDDGQEKQPEDGHVDHERELISQTDETVRQIAILMWDTTATSHPFVRPKQTSDFRLPTYTVSAVTS